MSDTAKNIEKALALVGGESRKVILNYIQERYGMDLNSLVRYKGEFTNYLGEILGDSAEIVAARINQVLEEYAGSNLNHGNPLCYICNQPYPPERMRQHLILDHTKEEVASVRTAQRYMLTGAYHRTGEQRQIGHVLLSENDRRIIKALLESKGRVSSSALSRELEIPQATIQRRRKKLEAFLETSYSLRLEEFGLKLVTFLISVEGEISSDIGRLILLLPKITSVVSTIGSHVDLQAWAVIENNQDIFRLLEEIKQIQGVKAVLWVEQICNIGENRDTYTSIIRHN